MEVTGSGGDPDGAAPSGTMEEQEDASVCWRCNEKLPVVVELAASHDGLIERLKCACCRREYPRLQFPKNQRRQGVVARRCPSCIAASGKIYAMIMEEDEYKDRLAASLVEREEKQRRLREQNERDWVAKVAARAKSRKRRNQPRELAKEAERAFDKKRRKQQQELLPKQVIVRIEAEKRSATYEREYGVKSKTQLQGGAAASSSA